MVMLFVLLTIPALRIFNHLLMTLPFPMADDLLASWDEALGFSWLDYAKLIAGQHIAVELMKYAYAFFYFAIIAVALEATLAGRFFRCQELLALTLMTAVTSSLIACLFPARGTMDRFADNAFRLQFSPDAGIFFIQQLLSARGADPVTLMPSSLAGLSTFPSFHTAAGILIIYACRGNSIRLAVGTAYSIVMIASTPVFGGHYFVDLIAGIALAIAMIMLWRAYGKKFGINL
jgi:membrane-associated phospholipid phosphatase